jgi:Spy/CpxP family protein refolding chaperone
MRHLGAGTVALATLALVAGVGLTADPPQANQHARGQHAGQGHGHHSRADALAKRLGLSDEQKQNIHKIHQEYDQKEDPIEHQIVALHHEEREAMGKVLTEEQRQKARQLLREGMRKEFEKIGSELNLSAEQKEKIGKVRHEYEQKFHQLASKGEHKQGQLRDLRREEFHAIRQQLNEEQRHKLPGILRAEFHTWHNSATRHEHMKALADKLDLSSQEKEQLHKIHEEYGHKIHPLVEQLRKVHHAEREAVAQVLTPEQRTKFQELVKERGARHGGQGARQHSGSQGGTGSR